MAVGADQPLSYPRFGAFGVIFVRKPVEIAVSCIQMSEAVEPGLEAIDRQNRFVSEHLRRIFVQIYRMVDNVADAQDLTQETFIKALQHQEQLKDEQKAAHWLSRIARNTAIDFLRRNSRVTFCEIDEAPESHAESPEKELLRGEHRQYLEDGLRLLSPRERQALLLRDVEGLPAEEVASILSCSKATVRSHIANARTKLRRYMERRKR
jgi:RNA polymerase sigma-70 factor, ECF subfamily